MWMYVFACAHCTYILTIHSAVCISDVFVCWKDQHCSGGAVTSTVVQYNLCIECTIWTQLAVLHREVSLIQRNICTQLYVVGAANSVLSREVSLIKSVLYREVPLYDETPQTVHIGTTVYFCCLCRRWYYVLERSVLQWSAVTVYVLYIEDPVYWKLCPLPPPPPSAIGTL